MLRKITNEKYKEQIKNLNVLCLEEYVNTHTKILHKCKMCGNEWKCSPVNIKQGHGCSKCRYKQDNYLYIYEQKYKNILHNKPIEMIEKFNGMTNKILHKCLKCNLEWKVSPTNIKRNRNCPNCAKSGLNPEAKGILYYIKDLDTGFYKIGITTNNLDDRFPKSRFNYEIMKILNFDKIKNALKVEQSLLKINKQYRIYNKTWYSTKKSGNGNTEFFTKNIFS